MRGRYRSRRRLTPTLGGGAPLTHYGEDATRTVTRVSRRCVESAPMRTLVRVIVAHCDLDAFFAAVEELEDPTLRRQPLIVGGDPRGRGVVATANYVARQFGIH